MSRFTTAQRCAVMAAFAGCCTTHHAPPQPIAPAQPPALSAPGPTPARPVKATIAPVAYQQEPSSAPEVLETEVPTAGASELSVAELVDAVRASNPTLQSMVAAWRAAAQRYPQVVSLDDPMFMTMMAPASMGTSQVDSAYVLEGAQKIPWFGKRAARGAIANADTTAAHLNVQDTELLLVKTTQMAFLDYYLVRRLQDLNLRSTDIVGQFRETAQSKYRANQVTQRDVLQADIELTEFERRRLELSKMNDIAVARINTLLRRAPGAELPPPPTRLDEPSLSADLETLQLVAVERRPDLASLAARVRAEQASVTLANKAYYPDGEFFGRYDSFWQPADTQSDLRGQAGVRLNVPLYRRRLDAAVCEAMLRLSERRAEYDQKRLDIEYEVQAAYAELDESRKTLDLYQERLIPIAEQNVQAARTNYDVGKESFLDLALAQRRWVEAREKQAEALATYHRRLAELNWATGGAVFVNENNTDVSSRIVTPTGHQTIK